MVKEKYTREYVERQKFMKKAAAMATKALKCAHYVEYQNLLENAKTQLRGEK